MREMTKYITCSKCGHSRILASGYCATEMTWEIWLLCLRKIGWTASGAIKCRACSSPFTVQEYLDYIRLKNERKQGSFGIVHFKKSMWKKYGDAVELFFATPDEPESELRKNKI